MPTFRIYLKDGKDHLTKAEGWNIEKRDDQLMVIFVAEGEAGKVSADPIEQSKRIAAAVILSELAAIIKVEDGASSPSPAA